MSVCVCMCICVCVCVWCVCVVCVCACMCVCMCEYVNTCVVVFVSTPQLHSLTNVYYMCFIQICRFGIKPQRLCRISKSLLPSLNPDGECSQRGNGKTLEYIYSYMNTHKYSFS